MRRLLAACLLISAGCSGHSGRPPVAPVDGTVTYRGRPVADAKVTFLGSGAPRLAVGTTDAAGHYRLTTFVENDGAMIGTHTVSVKKYAEPSADEPEPAAEPMDPKAMAKAIEAEMERSAMSVERAEKAGSLLPKKYADLRTSDLTKEVVAGENVINIDLSD